MADGDTHVVSLDLARGQLVHGNPYVCIAHLRGRAEAAEERVAALEEGMLASEPDTLDEALNRIGGWGRVLRQAIEQGEAIPPGVFSVSFRKPTEAEMAYGRTLIPMVEAIGRGEGETEL